MTTALFRFAMELLSKQYLIFGALTILNKKDSFTKCTNIFSHTTVLVDFLQNVYFGFFFDKSYESNKKTTPCHMTIL